MIYDLCYDKYNYRKYIPNKLFLCEDINIEYNYNNSSTNSLFNIFHLLEMSLYQIKQLLLNGEFISQLFLYHYFKKKRIINLYYKNNEYKQKINILINKDLYPNDSDYKIFSKKSNLEPLIININNT